MFDQRHDVNESYPGVDSFSACLSPRAEDLVRRDLVGHALSKKIKPLALLQRILFFVYPERVLMTRLPEHQRRLLREDLVSVRQQLARGRFNYTLAGVPMSLICGAPGSWVELWPMLQLTEEEVSEEQLWCGPAERFAAIASIMARHGSALRTLRVAFETHAQPDQATAATGAATLLFTVLGRGDTRLHKLTLVDAGGPRPGDASFLAPLTRPSAKPMMHLRELRLVFRGDCAKAHLRCLSAYARRGGLCNLKTLSISGSPEDADIADLLRAILAVSPAVEVNRMDGCLQTLTPSTHVQQQQQEEQPQAWRTAAASGRHTSGQYLGPSRQVRLVYPPASFDDEDEVGDVTYSIGAGAERRPPRRHAFNSSISSGTAGTAGRAAAGPSRTGRLVERAVEMEVEAEVESEMAAAAAAAAAAWAAEAATTPAGTAAAPPPPTTRAVVDMADSEASVAPEMRKKRGKVDDEDAEKGREDGKEGGSKDHSGKKMRRKSLQQEEADDASSASGSEESRSSSSSSSSSSTRPLTRILAGKPGSAESEGSPLPSTSPESSCTAPRPMKTDEAPKTHLASVDLRGSLAGRATLRALADYMSEMRHSTRACSRELEVRLERQRLQDSQEELRAIQPWLNRTSEWAVQTSHRP